VAYQWNTADGSGDGQYTFGASFPARLVPSDALQNAPLISLTSDDIGNILCWGGGLVCAGLIIFIIISSAKAAQKRKLAYLPPRISMEGHGIKRGLTPVETGILMEQPLDKLLTMILFSTIKKRCCNRGDQGTAVADGYESFTGRFESL